MSSVEDLNSLLALPLQHIEALIISTIDWKIIPLENLYLECKNGGQK